MQLTDLEIYTISREISKIAWVIYKRFDWQTKKIIGDQWITSIDSISSNIAEGFGRFHYLDKNKFNYNSRGSLLESIHWTEVLFEREFVDKKEHDILIDKLKNLNFKLNKYIQVTKNQSKSPGTSY